LDHNIDEVTVYFCGKKRRKGEGMSQGFEIGDRYMYALSKLYPPPLLYTPSSSRLHIQSS
jgi:hypothetical protein